MPESLQLSINGKRVSVPEGTSVAAAILVAGFPATRISVTGEPRGPLCGMGICFECRATVDGLTQRRTCQTACSEGMEIVTDGV